MKAKKKNRFLTFCFSLLPGAGEMYMGFMKMGLSLMLAFFGLFWISELLIMSELFLLSIVVWFYGFFHANHLASLNDEEFAKAEDRYLIPMEGITDGKNFVLKYHKWVAGFLILGGACLLWNTAADLMYKRFPAIHELMFMIGNYMPRVLIALLIMAAGIRMIKGKKAELAQNIQTEAPVQNIQVTEPAQNIQAEAPVPKEEEMGNE
ncbi:MAG: hypothetical protein IKY23_07440 [Lachnospiraceae bacterium]|nr:hypothetical protein [Lachnospiraceae bacterium]